jgi:hypothetical protein
VLSGIGGTEDERHSTPLLLTSTAGMPRFQGLRRPIAVSS